MKNITASKATKIVADLQPTNGKESITTLPPAPKLSKLVEPSFPIHVYPLSIQDMLKELNEKQGFSIDFSGTSLLSFIAAAAGSKMRLRAFGNWLNPLCLWTVIVGESGSRKTPMYRWLQKPFMEIEKDYEREYRIELGKYKVEMQNFEKGSALPIEPGRKDIIIKKGSFESFDEALSKNPHGIFFLRDEINGFLENINKYSKGDDQESLLEYYEGDAIKNNYKKGRNFIPFTNTCISGGVQPAKLVNFMRSGRDTDGTVFRFLYTFKDVKKPENIFKEGISLQTELYYRDIILNLHKIKFNELDEYHTIEFCQDCWLTFETWHNENAKRYNQSTNQFERGLMSKFEGMTLRLSLVLEVLNRQCENPLSIINPKNICVTKDSFLGACDLIEYFKFMANKMQGYIHNNPVQSNKKSRYQIDWVSVFGNREVMKRKELINYLVLNNKVSERTADSIIKDELYLYDTGLYSLFSPEN